MKTFINKCINKYVNKNANQATNKKGLFWGRLTLCVVAATLMAACGSSSPTQEPPPTLVPTTAPAATTAPEPTNAPEATTPPEATAEPANAQAESPLAQPASPLAQPESPISTTSTTSTTMSRPMTDEEAQALAALTKAPQPKPDFGTVSGVLYSTGTVPGGIRGTKVYLEKADEFQGKFMPESVSIGPQEADIVTESNELGQFQLEVPAGHYYVSVWTLYNWILAQQDPDATLPELLRLKQANLST